MEDLPSRNDELILEVATALERREMRVTVEADLEGFQVDVLAERGRGRSFRRLIVECKSYPTLVGHGPMRAFTSMFGYLRDIGAVHEGRIVSTSGFSASALGEAERHNVKAQNIAEFRREFGYAAEEIFISAAMRQRQARPANRAKKRVFVIMPFTKEMDDVFVLGISWVAKRLDAVAQRSTDFMHNGDVIAEVKRAIREYDVIIGDTTGGNPNVCYEVGFAHALDRPTVLVCREGEKLPFDIQGMSHILYANILELRENLEPRLRAALRA